MEILYIIFLTVSYIVILGVLITDVINPRFLWKTFENDKDTDEPTAGIYTIRRIISLISLSIILVILTVTLMNILK